MTCASSKAMDCCSVTDPDTPIVSRRKACRLRCSFCSSTNGSAVRSPTADSTIRPLPVTSRPANWKPHTTTPTKQSRRSSICWPRDGHVANAIVGVFLSMMRPGRIYLPAVREPLLNGLRLGFGVAAIGVLLAETKLSKAGIGFLVMDAYRRFDMPGMYALLILVVLLVAAVNATVTRLNRNPEQARS